MAPPPPRAMQAIAAMNAIGFSSKMCKPVLKGLLKLYDDNYDYIEDNGYQVLIASILKEQERTANGIKENRVADDNCEQSRKRAISSHEVSVSPSKHNSENSGDFTTKKQKMESDVDVQTNYIADYPSKETSVEAGDEMPILLSAIPPCQQNLDANDGLQHNLNQVSSLSRSKPVLEASDNAPLATQSTTPHFDVVSEKQVAADTSLGNGKASEFDTSRKTASSTLAFSDREDRMSGKKSIKTPIPPSSLKSPSKEKGDYTQRQSFITKQDEIDAILHQFGISGIETRVPGPSGRIDNPPEGFFAFSLIHIWHSGYLPLSDFLVRFLAHLKVAPIQLLPNSYTYLNCLQVLSGEAGLDSLDVNTLRSMMTFSKVKNQPDGTIYRFCPLHKDIISNLPNKTKEWENQFFYVRCHSPRIIGTFSSPSPAPKEISSSSIKKIDALSEAATRLGNRLTLLTEDNLRKYSLIMANHRVLGEPPMVKKNSKGIRSLVDGRPDSFSLQSLIQRASSTSPGYSPDKSLATQTIKGKEVKALPLIPKETTMVAPLLLEGSIEDVFRAAKRRKRDKEANKLSAILELPPSKKLKDDNLSQSPVTEKELEASLTSIGREQNINSVGVTSSQSPIINISDSPTADVVSRLYQEMGFVSPTFTDPLLVDGSDQSIPLDFEGIIRSVIQSPMVSSLTSLRSATTFSREQLYILLQHFLLMAKHMFLVQQISSSSSDQIPNLQQQNSALSDRIKALEDQTLKLTKSRDEALLEKDKLATCFEEEKKKSQTTEDRVKALEKELTQATTKIAELEEKMTKKDVVVAHSKATINDAKAKVFSFINQTLPLWRERCYEHALFLAYQDNIEKCSDMSFPSLPTLNTKLKRKFDIILDRTPGSLSEFPEDDPIDSVKLLIFDEPLSENENEDPQEGNFNEDENEDDDDDDDEGGGGARGQKSSGPGDNDDGSGGQGSGMKEPFPTFEEDLFNQPGFQDAPHGDDPPRDVSISSQPRHGLSDSTTRISEPPTQAANGIKENRVADDNCEQSRKRAISSHEVSVSPSKHNSENFGEFTTKKQKMVSDVDVQTNYIADYPSKETSVEAGDEMPILLSAIPPWQQNLDANDGAFL